MTTFQVEHITSSASSLSYMVYLNAWLKLLAKAATS